MKSLSVLFPELTEGQWAMLLRLLMEVAPEFYEGSVKFQAIKAYKRNITLLLEGEKHGG